MTGGRVRVEVLGPIRVVEPGGRDVTPAGSLQRRLLALLVLCRGRVVSVDAAADTLWPSGLPQDPAGALQNHVSRLRRGLPRHLIESIGEGYRLDPAGIELDCEHLADLLGDGATTDDAALAAIGDIVSGWHGPAFPELTEVDDARAEAERLGELRVRALEVRAEHRLSTGDTDGLVAELTALADGEPLRERPRALLMAALSATGRRVEALRVYDDFRRLLGDELGIQPSPSLVAQHEALLAEPDVIHSWEPPTRLPLPPSSLVGRDALVSEVTGLVDTRRLVSLAGPGGVGKTRLLLEAGHRLRAASPHRPVVLCELASAEEDSAVNTLAASLGIDARPNVPVAEQVASVVGDEELVVLVDNCEHVLQPVAEMVTHLVENCPNLTVLATSRERLRVPGEHVLAVPPLEVHGRESPAVQLFVERARAVAPLFDPGPRELATIAEIVERLDGLPLAIELAAARLYTHDVAEVAAGLDHRFSLLSTGYRSSSARHESLRAAVSWSFGLLPLPLQDVFASVSVFAGSFTADDASAVCELEVEGVRAALSQLVERSLVLRTTDRRYLLLETLRAFGAEQLAGTGRSDLVAERHARHMVAWVQSADQRMLRPHGTAIAEIDAAVPELQAALGWLVDHDEVELAGRLVASVLDFGIMRLRPDVLCWAERVAAADPSDRSPLAPVVWVVAAYAAWMAGQIDETGARSARALAAAQRAGGDLPAEVAAINGSYALFEGRLDDATRWYGRSVGRSATAGDEAQRIFIGASALLALAYAGDRAALERADALLAEIDDWTPHAAYTWHCAGEVDLSLGDHERARTRFARALDVAQETGATFVTGLAGAARASIDARWGDPAGAVRDFRWLIDHWRRAGMWSTQWTMLRSIAGLLQRLGRPRDAAVLVGAVSATEEGHRIFGSDEVTLRELDARLRVELGHEAYEAALQEGAVLDGDAAVEHALRSL